MNKQLIKASKRSNKLRVASKEYLNDGNKKDYEILPLVEFKYKMGLRGVFGGLFGICSLIFTDGGIGLLIGNELKNPISPKVRYRMAYKDMCRIGFMLFIGGLFHTIRISVSKKVRFVKRKVLRRRYC